MLSQLASRLRYHLSPPPFFPPSLPPFPPGQTHKFMGIRNGIDTELWSPSDNKFLPMNYDASNVEEGKRRWGLFDGCWRLQVVGLVCWGDSTGTFVLSPHNYAQMTSRRTNCQIIVYVKNSISVSEAHTPPTTIYQTGLVRSCASVSTCLAGRTRPSSLWSAG